MPLLIHYIIISIIISNNHKTVSKARRLCKMHLGKCGFIEASVLIGRRSRGLKPSVGWRGKLSRCCFPFTQSCVYIFLARCRLPGKLPSLRRIWVALHFRWPTSRDGWNSTRWVTWVRVELAAVTRAVPSPRSSHGGEVHRGRGCSGAHRGQTGGYVDHRLFSSPARMRGAPTNCACLSLCARTQQMCRATAGLSRRWWRSRAQPGDEPQRTQSATGTRPESSTSRPTSTRWEQTTRRVRDAEQYPAAI